MKDAAGTVPLGNIFTLLYQSTWTCELAANAAKMLRHNIVLALVMMGIFSVPECS